MGVMRFYRRQAESCLRLARDSSSAAMAERYRLMAQDMLDRAAQAPTDPELLDDQHASHSRRAASLDKSEQIPRLRPYRRGGGS